MTGKGEAVYQKLRNEIHTGKYLPGEKLERGTDLAMRYGVAHLTMRRVLERLKADGLVSVRPRVGLFVREAAHYRRVILVLDYECDRHSIFPQQLQLALVKAGCIISVFDTRQVVNCPEVFLSAFGIHQDFLVFNGATFFPWALLKKIPAATRLVTFHRCESTAPAGTAGVLSDYHDAGYQGTQALLSCGKRRLLLLVNDTARHPHCMLYRYREGACQAAAEFGAAAPELALAEQLSEKKIEALLRGGQFDGIIAGQDSFLVPVAEAALRLGLRVPEELALVGHYNTPWADELSLTSSDMQPEKIISEVVRVIQGGGEPQQPIPARMVYRKSCPRAI